MTPENQVRPQSTSSTKLVLGVVVVLVAVLAISFGAYQTVFKKTLSQSSSAKPTVSQNDKLVAKPILSGVVQKLEVSSDGKTGTLILKAAAGLPQENKPLVVYQVQVDDSVLVNRVAPAKDASATKPLTTSMKWQDIKTNKFANVHLNSELGSGTTVKISLIKDIEVVEN